MLRTPALIVTLACFLLGLPAAAGDRQVYINAVIMEVELGRGKTAADGVLFGLVPAGADGVKTIGENTARDFDFLNAYLERAEETKGVQVISRPFVYTADGERASISSGQRVAVPAETLTPLAAEEETAFRDVLMEMSLLGKISADAKFVTLTYDMKDERITGSTKSEGRQVPLISSQQASGTVKVRDRAIAVIDGLISERKIDRPILSRVPLLSKLAGQRKQRFETVIFLQPHVILDSSSLVESAVDEINLQIVEPATAGEIRERRRPPFVTRRTGRWR